MDKKLLKKIRKKANDGDWQIREGATDEIKKINDKYFEEYLPVWKEWIKDPNPNIRRALEVGLLRINKKHYREAFELLVPLLYDDENYVRKNCGPFALSAIAYRNPDDAFKRFRELIKEENQNVRWNIAMCLGVMFGVKYPKSSLELLKILAQDERRFVWRAVASSLIKLLRRFPEYKKEVYSWKKIDYVLDVVRKYVEK
ncbi:MAG: HEAT repeat domain-containing protein [Candidatus Edwardsbacteria bacterium]